MSVHQYTAEMVNDELNQFLEMQEGSIDSIMAQINPNPDFSTAQDIHRSLEINTLNQASTDEDGHLRTVHPSIRPCGQRTEKIISEK